MGARSVVRSGSRVVRVTYDWASGRDDSGPTRVSCARVASVGPGREDEDENRNWCDRRRCHGGVSRRGRRCHGTERIRATRRDAEIDRAARIVVVRDAGRYSGARDRHARVHRGDAARTRRRHRPDAVRPSSGRRRPAGDADRREAVGYGDDRGARLRADARQRRDRDRTDPRAADERRQVRVRAQRRHRRRCEGRQGRDGLRGAQLRATSRGSILAPTSRGVSSTPRPGH